MKRRHPGLVITLAVAVLTVSVARLHGQAMGSIHGTVVDPSGAAVPDASVVAQRVATGVATEVKASQTGSFIFPALEIGEYTLKVSAGGFKTAVQTGLRVVTGETVTVTVPLELGAVNQTVQVTGTASLVDYTRTTSGSTQLSATLSGLPINQGGATRHARDFLVTLPGVFGTSIADSTPIMGTGDAGPHRDPIMYRIDGQMATINLSTGLRDDTGPPPDLVQEFRLVANVDAEYGWTEGTGVELITKSGTNDFHGAVYEYLRNNALDARGFTPRTVPPQKQNNFGVFVGGPIVRNKHFFMASFDGFVRRTSGAASTATVATALERSGNFTELLGSQIGTDALGRPVYQGEIYDPATTRPDGKGGFIRDPFAYQGQLNVIDPSRFSSVSKFFQNLVPSPTRLGLTANWVGVSGRATDDVYRTYVKTDHNLGNHRITFGYEDTPHMIDHTTSAPGWDKLQGTNFDTRPFRVRIQDTWIVKPNLLLTTRVATNQVPRIWGNYSEPSGNVAKGILKGALTPEVPGINIPEVTSFGGFIRTVRCPQGTYPASVDLAWVRGKHNMKFGAEYMYQFTLQTLELFTAGNFGFTTRETGLPGNAATGVGYASFLLGAADSDQQWTPRGERHTSHNLGYYAQDSWKATPKLTLNYGLRWNIFIPFHESYNRIGAFSPSVINPKAGGLLGGLQFWGFGAGRNNRRRVADMNWGEFAPRFGFAYQVDSKSVFRAYYGIDNYPLEAELANGFIVPDLGYGAQVSSSSVDNGLTPLLYWDNGVNLLPHVPNLDPSLLNGTSVPFLNPLQTKAGRVQNLGAAVERDVGWGMLLRAEYVGKLVHGIPTNQLTRLNDLPTQDLALGNLLLADINSPAAQAAGIKSPYAGFTGPVYQALRPYPQYQFVSQVDSKNSYSLYHALLLTGQKRFRSGLSLLISYGTSKMLTPNDEGLNFNSFSPSGTVQAGNQQNVAKMLATYAPSQQFKASYSYDLPFGTKRRFLSNASPVVNGLVGGWTVAGIHLYQNGTPISISTELSNPGLGPVWATLLPGVPIRTNLNCGNVDINNPSQRTFLNINAFQSPAPFAFGNVRVLPSTRTCGFSNEDLSVFKDFPVRESIKVVFGADFFNAFNRHHWAAPSTDINNLSSFGGIFSASGARNIQFHLKLEF